LGTEEFYVPLILAAVSAAGQQVNQSAANSRAQNTEVQNLQQQQQLRQQANDQVKSLTQQISTNNPQQIADQDQTAFVNNLRKNEAGSAAGGSTGTNSNTFGQPVSALPQTISGASKQYQAGTANAQKEAQQYGNTEAGQMSAIDAAVRQRQNEGLAMQTLGTNLNLLGGQSQMSNFVNQLRAQTAGQSSPWASLFSGILGGTAKAGATNGWFSGPSVDDSGMGFNTVPTGPGAGPDSNAFGP
jgi:hypothetical protein